MRDGLANHRRDAQIIRTIQVVIIILIGTSCTNQPVATIIPPEIVLQPAATQAPTIIPLPSLTPSVNAPTGGLYVDVSYKQGEISPYIFGTNYGPQLFVPLQMQPFVEDAHITMLRYPGGNWGDNNDIELWNVDQFIAFARQIGAETNIHVRLKGSSPEKAAELVRYINIEKQYNVRYWAIGNEPNLYQDYSITQFNTDWRKFALAIKAMDPSIQLVGPEINMIFAHPANAYQQSLTDWLTEFLKENGDLVDIVSFHRYPFPSAVNGEPPKVEDLRKDTSQWDEIIPVVRALIHTTAGRDIPLAVTEINSSWVPGSGSDASLDSHYNAIWWGDTLGRLINQGVFMVDQFAIIGDFGLMDNYETYPIYNVYLMYKFFGSQRLFSASDDPMVSIYAAETSYGVPTIMIINLSSEPVTKMLTIDHGPTPVDAEMRQFVKGQPVEWMDPHHFEGKTRMTFPPESMTLYTLCHCGLQE